MTRAEATLAVADHWTPWTDFARTGQNPAPAVKMAGMSAPSEALKRPVNGGMSMSLADLETAARHQLPLIVVVMNDSAYGSEWVHLRGDGLPVHYANLPTMDFAAVAAALGATFLYGIAANYTKRALTGVPPLLVATGSMTGASLALLPIALLSWPSAAVSGRAWGAVITMAIACTAIAYIMYFRLIAKAGPATAMSVTFLIPVFGILWGALFLAEPVSPTLAGGVVLVLAGTALATGLLQKWWPRRAPHTAG